MAIERTSALAKALPGVAAELTDHDARIRALYGAWLFGAWLGNVNDVRAPQLCDALGGAFDPPHAETHAVVLPYVVAYNAPAAAEAMSQLAGALGADEPASALWRLGQALGGPPSRAALGVAESDIDLVASLAVPSPYAKPMPVVRSVRELLLAALGEVGPSVPCTR